MNFQPFLENLNSESFFQRILRDRAIVMDSTEFGYWSACDVKGLAYGGLRRSTTQGVTPLLFGGAIHKGLATHLLGGTTAESLDAVRAECVTTKLDSFLDPKRTTAKALQMIDEYILRSSITGEKLVPIELNGIKMVEQTFAFPLGEVNTRYFGKIEVIWGGVIDLINYYQNALFVTDHKTTSVMGEKFIDDKVRSNQPIGYVWAAKKLDVNLTKKVTGALINALAMRSTGFEFKLFTIPISQSKIDEWQAETVERCGRIVDLVAGILSHGDLVVPNRESCVTKYGKCPYFEFCESPESVRTRLLYDSAFFAKNEWNPTGAE